MTPKEIADSRLARGEITLEEHRKILEQLSPDSTINRRFAPSGGAGVDPRFAATPPVQPTHPPPVPAAPMPSTLEIVKGLAGIGFFVAVFFVYPFIARNNDINDARYQCEQHARRIGVNCECVERTIRNEASVLWYVPLLRYVVRPSDAMGESWLSQVTTQCRRR